MKDHRLFWNYSEEGSTMFPVTIPMIMSMPIRRQCVIRNIRIWKKTSWAKIWMNTVVAFWIGWRKALLTAVSQMTYPHTATLLEELEILGMSVVNLLSLNLRNPKWMKGRKNLDRLARSAIIQTAKVLVCCWMTLGCERY